MQRCAICSPLLHEDIVACMFVFAIISLTEDSVEVASVGNCSQDASDEGKEPDTDEQGAHAQAKPRRMVCVSMPTRKPSPVEWFD